MSSVPGRKDGDGRAPAGTDPKEPRKEPRTRTAPMMPATQAPPAAPPSQEPAVVVSRVLDVGPPLVPRHRPQAPPPEAPPPVPPPPPVPAVAVPPVRSAAATLGAMPAMRPRAPTLIDSTPPPAQPPRGAPEAPPPSTRHGRPAAPPVDVELPPSESLWDSVEALLDDVDAGFGAIMDGPPNTLRDPQTGGAVPGTGMKSPSGGMSGARELFAQLATSHVRHVRDFMIDVKSGQATADWLPICEPAVRSVRQMAEQLDLPELCKGLDGYLAALKTAAEESGFSVDGMVRDLLLAAYEPLVTAMPSAFGLDAVKSRREGIIVQSLLLQIPDVRKVTIDKLYANGLTALDAFFLAKADEIALTTGIDRAIAEKIVDRFARYKKELQGGALDEARSFEHKRLDELAGELATQQAAFEEAERKDESSKKRAARKAREAVLLEVKVLMARLGEVERVNVIERLPFSKKVAELRKYLEEARERT